MKKLPFRSNVQVFIVSALILMLSSCNVAYIPSMHNVPSLKEKNDFQCNISWSNFQGAYAVTDNVGILLNGHLSSLGNSSNDDVSYKKRRQFIEGGVGYYKALENDRLFQCYGGVGYGSIRFDNDYFSYTEHYQANATKVFIQPSISYINKNFEAAFALKMLSLKFFNVQTSSYSKSSLEDDQLYNLDKTPFFFVEPSFTFKAGSQNTKAFLQLLFSNKMNYEPIRYYNFNIFLGLTFAF